MNPDRGRLEELLDEVLTEDLPDADHANTVGRFRREIFWRKVRRSTAAGLVFSAVLAVTLFTIRTEPPQAMGVHNSARGQRPEQSKKSPDILSDQELVRLFPPDSCYLAEVNGKVVLVFKDEATRRQFVN